MNEEEFEEKCDEKSREVIFHHLSFERVVKSCLILVFRKTPPVQGLSVPTKSIYI